MQETHVGSLIQEDLTCIEANKPAHYNFWACALEPGNHKYWARELKLLKPELLETAPRQETPLQREAHAQLEKTPRSNQSPAQPK